MMRIEEYRTRKLLLAAVAVATCVLLGTMGCTNPPEEPEADASAGDATPAAEQAEGEGDEGAADANPTKAVAAEDRSGYPATSLLAQHTPAQLQDDFDRATCLGCHSRDSIVAATEDNVLGNERFNPHAAHESPDCTTCHSVEEESSVFCYTCHNNAGLATPQGWVAPEGSVLSE